MRRGSSRFFIHAFLDLPQHASASHCHLQGVVVSSEAIQTVSIEDVYGFRSVQSGRAVIHILLFPRRISWLFYNNTTIFLIVFKINE
jgi:hypothetical protein